MVVNLKRITSLLLFSISCFFIKEVNAQNTQIRGFVDAYTRYSDKNLSFGFGEQDLFITSDITDRLSFLGETVFRYTPSTTTHFSISIERIVLKYNFYSNHNILIGKHHTPLNYWNDTYHHGRVFFPTVDRPLLFSTNIFPLHTTGVSFQGHNLGTLKFGYDVMVGNGLGSREIIDNDKNKSLTVALHIKPKEGLRIGASYYYDVISKGAIVHENIIDWKVKQHLFTGSVAYFGNKFELLAESMAGINNTDTTGSKTSLSSYIYSGYKVTDQIVPYIRFDNLAYQNGEVVFQKNNTTSLVAGIRYNLSFLSVVKLEYQHQKSQINTPPDRITAQLAIGF